MTTPLPLPDDPRLDWLLKHWPNPAFPFRSNWLKAFENVLAEHYPHSTSRQRTLTARLAAPFPLAQPGVP